MDDLKQSDSEIIKALCSIIDDEQKREEKLINIIKELSAENARLRRKRFIFFHAR